MLAAFRNTQYDRAIFALAIPALGTLAIDPLVSIVDTVWVARLGTVPLAALAVASAVFAAVFSIFNFVHMAITPLVAGDVGRGELKQAGSIATGAVLVALVVGIVVAVVAGSLSGVISGAFGAADDVTALATEYLRVRFVALPAMLLVMVGHGVFRGHSNTTTPLFVAIGMNLVNLVLDPVFIFGLDMGVVGAAWATVVAQWIAAVWFLVLIFGLKRRQLGIGGRISDVGTLGIGKILNAGWPMMVRSAALLASLTAITVAAARIGTVEVAAYQIALQVWLFLSFVLDSYAVAAQAMVGTFMGSEEDSAARGVSNRLLALGLMTGIGLSVVLGLTVSLVLSLFSVEPEVRDQLRFIYPFVVVLQPITALVYVWDGIGIGASAFRYLAGSMVVAGLATMLSLAIFGSTLAGIGVSLVVLTVTRMVALAWWYRSWPSNSERDPSPSSQAV